MKEEEMEGGEREQRWCCCDGQVKAAREMGGLEQMPICMAFNHRPHVNDDVGGVGNVSVQYALGHLHASRRWLSNNLVFLSSNGAFA